jgi:hypothetical protein
MATLDDIQVEITKLNDNTTIVIEKLNDLIAKQNDSIVALDAKLAETTLEISMLKTIVESLRSNQNLSSGAKSTGIKKSGTQKSVAQNNVDATLTKKKFGSNAMHYWNKMVCEDPEKMFKKYGITKEMIDKFKDNTKIQKHYKKDKGDKEQSMEYWKTLADLLWKDDSCLGKATKDILRVDHKAAVKEYEENNSVILSEDNGGEGSSTSS